MSVSTVEISDRIPWPRKRLRGVKAQGVSYEKAVAARLKLQYRNVEHGLWLRYSDESCRWSYAQPDLIIRLGGTYVVCECKRTWRDDAWEQIEKYMELVQVLYDAPTYGLLICKNLTPAFHGTLVQSLEGAIRPHDEIPTWHLMSP